MTCLTLNKVQYWAVCADFLEIHFIMQEHHKYHAVLDDYLLSVTIDIYLY